MDENVQRAPETNVQRLQISERQHEEYVKENLKRIGNPPYNLT